MSDEQKPRRKSSAARPDFRKFLAEPARAPADVDETLPLAGDVETNPARREEAVIPDSSTQGEPRSKATKMPASEPVDERKRYRTTIFLPPELEDLIDIMKMQAKRRGRRESLQQMVEEGLRLLARERGVLK
ncbi:MAG: hypothetical protein NVS2B7_28850 [Herpetosiphon sp.]